MEVSARGASLLAQNALQQEILPVQNANKAFTFLVIAVKSAGPDA